MINDGITKKEKICSFLMIGQSNMAGRGEFGDVEPIYNDKCFMLRMGSWQPGELLYDHAVAMAKLAMRTSDLCGIIWHQGESDCCRLNENDFRQAFLNIMTSLQKDLGEKLPIIIGEISDKITEKWGLDSVENMNKLLHKLQKEIPLCEIVSVDGLELKADGIHFNSKSYRELGKRYFEKYRDIVL